jgi:hypothetical protein
MTIACGYVTGDKLNHAARRDALACYCHRFTMEHVPQWAMVPRADGTFYAPQFASDAEWLAHTTFRVTQAGRLALNARYCHTAGQTWPMGQTLNNPYNREH